MQRLFKFEKSYLLFLYLIGSYFESYQAKKKAVSFILIAFAEFIRINIPITFIQMEIQNKKYHEYLKTMMEQIKQKKEKNVT